MNTYARLVTAGDEWKGQSVRRLERRGDRVLITLADGSEHNEWAEARLNVKRPLYRYECMRCGRTTFGEGAGSLACCLSLMERSRA